MTAPADDPQLDQDWRQTFRRVMRGCWLLANFDPRAADYFPSSRADAIRSFWAVPITLPFYLAARIEEGGRLRANHLIPDSVPFWVILFAEIWLFIISVLIGPVVIWEFARRLDRKREYFGWLTAWNWSGLILEPAMAIAGLLSTGLVDLKFYSDGQAELFMLIITCLAITYVWIGFHLLLKVSAWMSTFLTILALVGMQLILRFQLTLYSDWN